MIVDDAALMRTLLKNFIEESGHEVIGVAQNGKEAVELFDQLKPDVITMDITMPDMDGITAVKKILSKDPKAKIIICSAMGQQKFVLDAIAAGAKDYLIKPFQRDRIIESIDKILARPE